MALLPQQQWPLALTLLLLQLPFLRPVLPLRALCLLLCPAQKPAELALLPQQHAWRQLTSCQPPPLWQQHVPCRFLPLL